MKRWARRGCATVAFILLAIYALGLLDYWRVKDGEKPLFVLNWDGFFDGGTFVGVGFGYHVIANHGCKYAMEHGRPADKMYWTDGPELKFWFFPFLNKSELRFKPLEGKLGPPDGK